MSESLRMATGIQPNAPAYVEEECVVTGIGGLYLCMPSLHTLMNFPTLVQGGRVDPSTSILIRQDRHLSIIHLRKVVNSRVVCPPFGGFRCHLEKTVQRLTDKLGVEGPLLKNLLTQLHHIAVEGLGKDMEPASHAHRSPNFQA